MLTECTSNEINYHAIYGKYGNGGIVIFDLLFFLNIIINVIRLYLQIMQKYFKIMKLMYAHSKILKNITLLRLKMSVISKIYKEELNRL